MIQLRKTCLSGEHVLHKHVLCGQCASGWGACVLDRPLTAAGTAHLMRDWHHAEGITFDGSWEGT